MNSAHTPAPILLRNIAFPGGTERFDVRIEQGRVASITPVTGAARGVDTASFDLDGCVLLPGLWDSHVHFTQWATQLERLDLSATSSAAAALALVRQELERTNHDVLIGYGFRDGLWSDAPSLSALDATTGNTPVALISGDLHCGWVNSAAARRFGLTLPDSGMLAEVEWFAALERIDAATQLPDATFAAAAEAAAARGVTGITDFEHADLTALWPARIAAGVDSLRVEAAVWPDLLDAALSRGLRTGDLLDEQGLVTMGPLKVVVDGSLNTRTAWCWEQYPGIPEHAAHPAGIASVPQQELLELMRRAREGGLTAAIHAIGDRANAAVLDAFEALGMTGTIEHAQLLRDEDFARFARLGIVASVQPEHAMDDRDVADRHWAGRTERAFAIGSLHRAGVQLSLGSDAPVAPLDPWHAIASATSRSRGDRAAWHPEQCIPIDVALASSMRGPRTVRAGAAADLVVVERDPLTAGRDELRDMPVIATLLGGRFTFSRLG